jgi:hypothetical protein
MSKDYTIDTIDFAEDVQKARGSWPDGYKYTLGALTSPSAWIDIIRWDADTKTGLARSARTGQLYAFKISGRVVRSQMIRVAIYPLVDLSLNMGTLHALHTMRFAGRVNEAFYFGVESF